MSPGFEHINDFLATVRIADEDHRLPPERRERIAKKLAALTASQRKIAKTLGVGDRTIREDLGKPLWWDGQEKAQRGALKRGRSRPLPVSNARDTAESLSMDRVTIHRWRTRLKDEDNQPRKAARAGAV